jgi:hypothetical protein
MSKLNDLAGRTFGRLFAVCQMPHVNGRVTWHCICDCGKLKTVDSKALITRKTASCGCLRVTHGKTATLLHKVWLSMRERCNNPKARAFQHYGARGIKVCPRWDDFEMFLEDMGPRPPGMSIERIDNDGDYEPGNCRWATDFEQMQNTSRTRLLTAGGETLTASTWTRRLGAASPTIHNRLKNGWTVEQACLTPVGQPRL